MMKAQDIMARNPRCVTPRTTVQEAARLMKSEDVGALPVVSDDGSRKLIGMITDRDITLRVVAEGKNAERSLVEEVMSTKGLASAKTNDTVEDVMKVMGKEQVRRIPIVNENDEVVGVVSQADVVLRGDNTVRAERTIEKISEPGSRHS
jgi:CBS domain-containing protein